MPDCQYKPGDFRFDAMALVHCTARLIRMHTRTLLHSTISLPSTQVPSSRLGSTIMKDEEGILLVIVLQRINQTCTIKCRQVVGGVHEKKQKLKWSNCIKHWVDYWVHRLKPVPRVEPGGKIASLCNAAFGVLSRSSILLTCFWTCVQERSIFSRCVHIHENCHS